MLQPYYSCATQLQAHTCVSRAKCVLRCKRVCSVNNRNRGVNVHQIPRLDMRWKALVASFPELVVSRATSHGPLRNRTAKWVRGCSRLLTAQPDVAQHTRTQP